MDKGAGPSDGTRVVKKGDCRVECCKVALGNSQITRGHPGAAILSDATSFEGSLHVRRKRTPRTGGRGKGDNVYCFAFLPRSFQIKMSIASSVDCLRQIGAQDAPYISAQPLAQRVCVLMRVSSALSPPQSPHRRPHSALSTRNLSVKHVHEGMRLLLRLHVHTTCSLLLVLSFPPPRSCCPTQHALMLSHALHLIRAADGQPRDAPRDAPSASAPVRVARD